MKDIIIHNVKACFQTRIENTNVLIRKGKIHQIGINISEFPDAEIIDANSAYLLPGFIDVHTHLEDVIGGYDLADTYKSGSKIAIENGITTIYSFVTQTKEEKLINSVSKVRDKAPGNSYCNIGWHITPTNMNHENIDELKILLQNNIKTIKLYTTYKEAGIYSSYDDIKKIAGIAKENNATIMVHCEDEEILHQTNNEDQDFTNAFSHSLIRTEDAEIRAIENIIEIAEKTGCRFHVVHVSTPTGIDLINQAKKEEVSITCETGPQYLLMNNSILNSEDGYIYLCTPPLRDEAIHLAMYEKSINGEIDIYATDHCAFTKKDKSEYKEDLRKVPKGLPGIGALIPMIYEINKYKGDECFLYLAKHISENPAKLVGLYPQKGVIEEGSDADLVLLAKGEKRKIKSTQSDSFDPYEDYETDLNILKVFLKGNLLVESNKLLTPEVPKGELL